MLFGLEGVKEVYANVVLKRVRKRAFRVAGLSDRITSFCFIIRLW